MRVAFVCSYKWADYAVIDNDVASACEKWPGAVVVFGGRGPGDAAVQASAAARGAPVDCVEAPEQPEKMRQRRYVAKWYAVKQARRWLDSAAPDVVFAYISGPAQVARAIRDEAQRRGIVVLASEK